MEKFTMPWRMVGLYAFQSLARPIFRKQRGCGHAPWPFGIWAEWCVATGG